MPTPPLHQTTLNLLARRDHSKQELYRKLLVKKYPPEEIQNILNKLESEGLLNETRFMENFIHFRRTKGIGPLRIKMELIEKGIPESLIEAELNITDNAWQAEAMRVWQKKFKNQKPHDFKTRIKQMRFLQQRGFTKEQIESVLP